MTLSEELKWRGFVNQTTLKDLKSLDNKKRTFYHGFDASADSQTVGNLAALMFDKVFLRHGYEGILLAGGSTSQIGDPGGKDKERLLQDEETVAHNIDKAEQQIKRVLHGHEFKMVNNLDWTKDLKVLPFLRDIGKHFSMTPLIQRDFIATRLGAQGGGISYAEFSYTILQGFDFLYLFDNYGVTLQFGGSDQWGNCLSGVELIRKARGKEVDVVTHQLVLDKSTGKKFGKSERGAIWLDSNKTSPNDFYQFWLNVDDEGVEQYLKIFTDLDKNKLAQIMTDFNKDKAGRLAQKTLAREVTIIVHGEKAARQAQESAKNLRLKVSASLPSPSAVANVEAEAGSSIVNALTTSGLASSKTEARKLLASGGVYINDNQTTKNNFEESDFVDGLLKLRRGKTLKNTVIIELI